MVSFKRIVPLLALILALPAAKARANTYVVDSTASSTSGQCTSAANDCPLGAAITLANARSGADTITFASSVSGISLTQALPTLTDAGGVTIVGATGGNTSIERRSTSGNFRIFNLAQSAVVTLSNLDLNGGNVNDAGGAVNSAGTLSIFDCGFYSNSAASGGAIANAGGKLTIQRCTFFNNGASANGGGIFNAAGSGTATVADSSFENNGGAAGGAIANASDLTVRRCTFSGNAGTSADAGTNIGGGGLYNSGTLYIETSTLFINNAQTYGGGILNGGNLTVRSCTFSQNTCNNGGGSVANTGTSVVFGNTIFNAGTTENVLNLPGTGGSFSSEGYNISSDATGPSGSSDKLSTDPLVDEQLTFNSNGPSYLAISFRSPAVDGGLTTISPDARGVARPVDIATIANAPGGNGADVGAYELTDEPQTDSFLTVNTLGDANDGVCSAGDCSLREALNAASADAGVSGIGFTENVRGTITLGGTVLPTIRSTLAIYGPGADALTISGNGQSGIFALAQAGEVAIYGLTLSNGSSASGGAISSATATSLTLNDCVLSGNKASSRGGAIYATGTPLVLDRCTLNGNASAADGAGLYFVGNLTGQSATLSNCTFDGNAASAFGGAIYVFSGLVSLDSDTLSANSAAQDSGGGVASYGSSNTRTEVRNSIISGNAGGDVQFVRRTDDSFVSLGYNLVGTGNAATDAFVKTGDQNSVSDPKLNALALNDGSTPTRLPQADSPAINRGDTELTNDQRGIARPQGNADDIGAVEVQPPATTVTVAPTLAPASPRTNDTLTATANASASDGSAPTLSYLWRKNGEEIPGETDATLQLSKPGNGDKNDVISVEVTATAADGTTATGTASVTVVNSAPIAISSKGEVPADTEKGFPLLGFDADGDALTFERVGGPKNGVKADIRVDPTDGVTKLFYRSRPFYGGVDVIRFVARDSDGKLSNESTLGISVQYTPPPPANRAPIAGDTNIDTYVGDTVIKGLLGSDPDGDALTFRIVSNAKYGSSEIKRDTDGVYKLFYTSLNRFYGPDRVIYIATDSRGKESNLATVNINFINRAPVAQGNKIQVASGALVSQYLFGTDADGDALTFRLVNNPRYGAGEVKRDEQGKWRFYYRSLAGYAGPDQITFIAIDPQGKQSAVAAIDITVVRVSGSSAAPSGGGA